MSISNSTRTGLFLNIVLLGFILIGLAYAQRPPEYDGSGAAYLRVNINPTEVPPMVNINPNQTAPRVRVTEMPAVRVPPVGCENRQNYLTGIGRTISGPAMITYLHLPEQTRVTLNGAGGSHSINLGSSGQIRTAIFLQANQRMDFDTEIMYSGCRPE
jgi:hypothetical protein